MHNYKDPSPPTPSTTNKEKSIIPLKQCNCKGTTHSSTYWSNGTKSMCTTRTLISQQTQLGLFSFNTATSERTMDLEMKDFKKVYITSLCIVKAYFKFTQRKREHAYPLVLWVHLKEEAFSHECFFCRFSFNHFFSAAEMKWTPCHFKRVQTGLFPATIRHLWGKIWDGSCEKHKDSN